MRILLGMSGGLDSAYAVRLLTEAGYRVEGAVLCMHDHTDLAGAQRCADEAGIPLHVVDCRERFRERVVSYFVSTYRSGMTPNPCTVCNSDVKFASLAGEADRLGIPLIATGHYAGICRTGERFAVRRGADSVKDQSYMLWRLPQQILGRLVLPLADLTKAQVRADAAALGMAVAAQAESQDLCFVPDGSYADFVENNGGFCPEGDFVDADGRVLGRHHGILRYTVGQTKGLGIALGTRMAVTAIDPERNTVTLTPAAQVPPQTTVTVGQMSFMGAAPDETPGDGWTVQVRYRARPVPVSALDTSQPGVWRVTGGMPFRPVPAPGQSAVFYRGDVVMCGGFLLP